jgi:DNA-binding NtrC family response regulator
LEITLPPLRERVQDIERLALHFVAKLGAEMSLPPVSISPAALDQLRAYSWPGNIRELRNVIERALVLNHNHEIGPEHLPREFRASPALFVAPSHTESLDKVIQRHIIEVYQQNQQNLAQTASRLGISRLSLRKRLKAYGLKRSEA